MHRTPQEDTTWPITADIFSMTTIDKAIKHAERFLQQAFRDAQHARHSMANALKYDVDMADDLRSNAMAEIEVLARIETFIACALGSLPDDPDLRARCLHSHMEAIEALSAD